MTELHLSRWDDECGDSQGWWLIRELPGLYLMDGPAGWEIGCYWPTEVKDAAGTAMESPNRVWGEGWQASDALYESLPERLTGHFATRSELLERLQAYLAAPAEPALGELISP